MRKSSSQCRVGDQFVIRKIERDRNTGQKFAPVCEVNLSSSGSSSDEDDDVIKRRGVTKSTDVNVSTSLTPEEDFGDSMTTVDKSVEENWKLPPPKEDVVKPKRWNVCCNH